jgi:hypothetical protein
MYLRIVLTWVSWVALRNAGVAQRRRVWREVNVFAKRLVHFDF